MYLQTIYIIRQSKTVRLQRYLQVELKELATLMELFPESSPRGVSKRRYHGSGDTGPDSWADPRDSIEDANGHPERNQPPVQQVWAVHSGIDRIHHALFTFPRSQQPPLQSFDKGVIAQCHCKPQHLYYISRYVA